MNGLDLWARIAKARVEPVTPAKSAESGEIKNPCVETWLKMNSGILHGCSSVFESVFEPSSTELYGRICDCSQMRGRKHSDTAAVKFVRIAEALVAGAIDADVFDTAIRSAVLEMFDINPTNEMVEAIDHLDDNPFLDDVHEVYCNIKRIIREWMRERP